MRLIDLAMLLLATSISAPVMAESSAPLTLTNLPLTHKGSGTLYVQTSLGSSQQVGWLVDTGSDFSVIDKASIDKLLAEGKAHYLKKLRGKMADGSERVIPLYVVDRLQLAGNCELHKVKVAVLPNSSRRIMGLSALRQLAPFSVSFDPPTLTVSGCQPSYSALSPETVAMLEPKTKPPAQGAGGELSAANQ